MQAYFVNFIKTFNPNSSGLPNWPAYRADDPFEWRVAQPRYLSGREIARLPIVHRWT